MKNKIIILTGNGKPAISANNIYMKELVSKIQEVYATFSTDAALQIEKGNN